MAQQKKYNVLVFMGGPSPEHAVSLETGKGILQNLNPEKYKAIPIVVTRSQKWVLLPSPSIPLLHVSHAAALPQHLALRKAQAMQPDVAFLAMHGAYGEDGIIQGILEAAGIPYTGSNVLASALGMDKPRSSILFQKAGLTVPDFLVLTATERMRPEILTGAVRQLSWPIVVKPANNGSSVGVSIARDMTHLRHGTKEAGRYAKEIILQKFIAGTEIACGVLEDRKGKLISLPPIEIVPQAGKFYDYRAKYAAGGSRHFIPPRRVSQNRIVEIKKAACTAHAALRCSGMSRADFILGNDGKLYILEINTIPGMTPTSLLPESAKAVGITFPHLLDIIVENALARLRGLSTVLSSRSKN